jgi:hypothetical protein
MITICKERQNDLQKPMNLITNYIMRMLNYNNNRLDEIDFILVIFEVGS